MQKNILDRMKKIFVALIVILLIAGCTRNIFGESRNTSNNSLSLDIPTYFSWRNVDGTDFTTSVKDMSPCPACEAFAVVAAVETMVQYEIGHPFGCDLSEAHLFFCSGGTCRWGEYIENATNYLREYGVPDELCFPWSHSDEDFPCNSSCQNWQNRTVKISEWGYLPDDINSIKNALIDYGPVVAFINVYKDFRFYRKGVYEHRWGRLDGGHWITIVGYDNEQECWICKNSWGKNWGENGWFQIRYGECKIEKHAIYLKGVYGNFPFIFVDDDNVNGPWDGTREHPYQCIQDGIDNAFDGYTVYVLNGTYFENVIVNKSIDLIGENRNKTIINGRNKGDVISIYDEGVNISGFTIKNGGKNPFNAGIESRSSKTKIYGNDIQKNDLGIYLYYSDQNIITNNIIQNNTDGIYLWWSSNNLIQDNIIQNNADNGIEIDVSWGFIIGNVIIRNTIQNSSTGIYLDESNKNIIAMNNLKNNDVGIELCNSDKNKIFFNNFIDNDAYFFDSFFNHWNRNFWNSWRFPFPKPIWGHVELGNRKINWVNFDRHPLIKPIDKNYGWRLQQAI